MPTTIDVVPTGPTTFTGFVVESHRAPSRHQVEVTPEFLTETGLEVAGPERVAHQALVCMLGDVSTGRLPERVRLHRADECDPLLLQSLCRYLLR